jgi:hypothetical protein
MAQTETVTAPDNQVIWAVNMEVPHGTTGSFTATLTNSDTVDGSFSYTADYLLAIPLTTADVTLGGNNSVGHYEITGLTTPPLYMQLWHADTGNYTRQLKLGYGQSKPWWNDVLAEDVDRYPVKSFSFTADQDVVLDYEYLNYDDAMSQLAVSSAGASWVDQINKVMVFAITVFTSAIDFAKNLLHWLKFFFIDNGFLIIVLYIAVTMAFAARKARGRIDVFFKTFFSDQKKLFSFIMELWRMLIETIGTIRGWFRL